MRIITCISFHSTGSSVVDDIFKEFDNCVSAPSDIECRFLQDPDGISDLEYNLVDNPHRLNSGFAIKRYEKFVKKYNHTYKFIFGDRWLEASKDYIKSLITVEYKGFWFRDLELMPTKDIFLYYLKRIINLIKHPMKRISGYYVNCPNESFYHTNITKEQFIERTKVYINKLCAILNEKNVPFLLLDQCVPTSNIDRYTKYFDDIKVIVVDRDPRDVYIEHKHNKDHVLPSTPEEFCEVYIDHRSVFKNSNKSNVLYMRFEDFIYHYEESLNELINFVGQDKEKHINKNKFFKPEVSQKNTQLWVKYPQYQEDIKIIEERLADYLYNE